MYDNIPKSLIMNQLTDVASDNIAFLAKRMGGSGLDAGQVSIPITGRFGYICTARQG